MQETWPTVAAACAVFATVVGDDALALAIVGALIVSFVFL